MKKALQIAGALLALSAVGFVMLPFAAGALGLSPLGTSILAAAAALGLFVLGNLAVTLAVELPFERFLAFLKSAGKKCELPPALPFRAPRELMGTYAALEAFVAELKSQSAGAGAEKKYDEARHRLLTTVSHRLRTPLTGLKWALNEFVAREQTFRPGDAELLRGALDTTSRIGDIIESSLRAAAVGEEFPAGGAAVDVERLIENCIEESSLLAKSRGCALRFDPPAEPIPSIEGRAFELELALQNIVANAVHYSRKGGEVRVTLSRTGTSVKVRVEDRGIGIPPGELKTLFRQFNRGRGAMLMNPDGAGIGLYLANGIVVNHGGAISIESEVGRGTAVTIELPIRGKGELEAFIAR